MSSQVNPTKIELSKAKKSLAIAAKGHKLLKDQQDQMTNHFIRLIRENYQCRQKIQHLLSRVSREAHEAEAELGRNVIEEALLIPAYTQDDVQIRTKQLMNIEIPVIEVPEERTSVSLPYNLAQTSEQLDKTVLDMTAMLPQLLKLAEIEKTCMMLAAELEKTRRRINALEYIKIPELQDTVRRIAIRLEENERSNLSRLMKVKELKFHD